MESRINAFELKTGQPQKSILLEADRCRLYGLDFGYLFHGFFREGAAFFFLCFYYFVEYTRFQTIFPQIGFLPYGSLSIALTLLLLPTDRYRKHPNYLLVFSVYGFIFLTFFSMTYALDSKEASDRGYVYLNWLIVFFMTVSLITNERRFVFFLLLYLLWNFKISQHGARIWANRGFGFAGWGISGPQGWFQNSGELGLQMAMVCIISCCFFIGIRQYLSGWRRWVILTIPVTSFMSVIASSTRGDYLAMAAGLLWLTLVSKGNRIFIIILVTLALAIGYWAMPPEMLARFQVAGSEEDYTSMTRETRWKAGFEIFRDHPILGVGTGSWVTYYYITYYYTHYPREPGREGWGLPHNSFIEVIGEHGGFGLAFLVLIFAGMFILNRQTRAIASHLNDPVASWLSRGLDAATVAFLVGGSFMSVFHYPYVWVHAAMIVGLYTATQRNLAAPPIKPPPSTPSP